MCCIEKFQIGTTKHSVDIQNIEIFKFVSACVQHSAICQVGMNRKIEQVSKHLWNFICLLLTFSVSRQVYLFNLIYS